MKTCKYCGYEGNNFYSYNKVKCKDCVREYNRKRMEDPDLQLKEKYRGRYRRSSGERRAYDMKSKYGITPEQYEEMLAAQGGVCAICKKGDPKHKSDNWPIDHNHSTGEVRGLLCSPCNTLIGLAQEDVDILMSAAAYLMTSTDILGVENASTLTRSCNE